MSRCDLIFLLRVPLLVVRAGPQNDRWAVCTAGALPTQVGSQAPRYGQGLTRNGMWNTSLDPPPGLPPGLGGWQPWDRGLLRPAPQPHCGCLSPPGRPPPSPASEGTVKFVRTHWRACKAGPLSQSDRLGKLWFSLGKEVCAASHSSSPFCPPCSP